jgi:uncharacterized protein
MDRALLIVAKRPAAGQTKTRLCPPLSGETAAEVYQAFLYDSLAIMRHVMHVQRTIAYMPANALGYFQKLAPDFELFAQQGDTLGERLDHLLTHALQQGAQAAIVMSSDSPTLPADYIEQAFLRLEQGADVVLGPSDDGGYYLIGVKQPQPRLLREVQMSTPTVLQETLALASELTLVVHLLPAWYDVDTIDELERLSQELSLQASQNQLIASHTYAYLQTLDFTQLVSQP